MCVCVVCVRERFVSPQRGVGDEAAVGGGGRGDGKRYVGWVEVSGGGGVKERR